MYVKPTMDGWCKDVTSNGSNKKVYIAWCGIKRRVCNPKLHKERPTYADCKVNDEWLLFSNFQIWYKLQNKGFDWELDKDIIKIGNKCYGPEFCAFVPSSVNLVVLSGGMDKMKFLPGAGFHKASNKFRSRCRDNKGYRIESLHETELEAHQWWVVEKTKVIEGVISDWTGRIDDRIIKGLYAHIKMLKLLS